PESWRAVYAATGTSLAGGVDAVLIVTPFVNDESPLYVSRDASGVVRGLGEVATGPAVVTGGVYGFNPSARLAAAEAVRDGVQRGPRRDPGPPSAPGEGLATGENERDGGRERPSPGRPPLSQHVPGGPGLRAAHAAGGRRGDRGQPSVQRAQLPPAPPGEAAG